MISVINRSPANGVCNCIRGKILTCDSFVNVTNVLFTLAGESHNAHHHENFKEKP